MKVSIDGLKGLLLTGVVELTFVRRHPKANWGGVRRILCTNSRELLTGITGKVALHFRPPSHTPSYPAHQYGLVTAWDLLWQDYRQIDVKSAYVVAVMPLKTQKDIDDFWIYFNDVLQKMSPDMKNKFMDNKQ